MAFFTLSGALFLGLRYATALKRNLVSPYTHQLKAGAYTEFQVKVDVK